MQRLDWQVGDTARLKKPHACGSFDWHVERVGMDMRLVCVGCGRVMTMGRHDFNCRVKARLPQAPKP